MNNPLLNILIKIPGILIGITFHEFAHGLIAYSLGDKTPKREGRLTLNPIAHIDPIGLLLLFFINFGWAKPIHTNPSSFKNRKKAMIMISIMGPIANLLVAVLFTAILKIISSYNLSVDKYYILYQIINYGILINIILAVFNLIPIPPLDGSKILFNLIPPRTYFKIIQYQYILQIVLIVLLLMNVISKILDPIVWSIYEFLTKIFGF
ncbi:site-2 protease family protein [Defluviitalea phaphyphila]|uniref:site-2 protease family protein n=1 Tax=Defluviitalea phaphyphila TaxID=1473580 RepID=UPI000731720B|nr:site-2 protease family protein [Defluviitalea phaphyphila]